MTADLTIHATPGQVAAVERDGFLVVTAPTISRREPLPTDGPDYHADHEAWVRGGSKTVPVPTTKPCLGCGGSGVELWVHPSMGAPPRKTTCPTCNGDGTVPIVVEVVVDEGPCDCRGPERKTYPEKFGDIEFCRHGPILPARTILRGTVEAVPVVDKCSDGGFHICESPGYGVLWHSPLSEPFEDGQTERDVTDHFPDARPEVGGTAWIIREEGT